MGLKKMRLFTAGLIAFLLGMPLAGKAFAGTADIIYFAVNLALSIAGSSDAS